MATIIGTLLENDAKGRVPGVEGKLFRLEDLTPGSWDYSSPTLVRNEDSEAFSEAFSERRLRTDSERFAKDFYLRYPHLEGVALDNLLVAGSSVGQFIDEKSNWQASDIDIFIFGLDPAGAAQRLRDFAGDLVEHAHERAKRALVSTLVVRQKKLDQKRAIPRLFARGPREEKALNELDALIRKNKYEIELLIGPFVSWECHEGHHNVLRTTPS